VDARFRRLISRSLPRAARRGQKIDDLTRRVAALEQSRQEMARQPSFQVRINEEKRLRSLEVELGAPSRSVIAGGKFHVYDFVRSHGIDVPEQLGRWDDPADIPWNDLPDKVVIKSAYGNTSNGVLPLHRVGRDWQVVTHSDTVTGERLATTLAERVVTGKVGSPFAAEEFLDHDGAGTPPIDTKVYSFYGQTPLILLRRSDDHGNPARSRHRVLDPEGGDLVETFAEKETDHEIPVPEGLGEIVDVAARLSIALRVPFARIDLYRLQGRIVFGEVTPRPGGSQWLGPDLDARLGEAWERAQVRLWRDIAGGTPREPDWGPVGQE
jgi:teichuronopeptide biosynthesis TupA-like protein